MLVPLQHPFIDASRAPIYVMEFGEKTTDDELKSCCDARENWAKVAQYKVAWVVDLSRILEVTAKQRRIFADHLARFEPHDIAFNQGSALIVPNTFLRGVVTAIFWLKPPRFPNQTFGTRTDAFAWAESQLRGGATTHASL
jgi:hypothetical protein